MSTKLYNGYYILEKDFSKILKKVNSFKKSIQDKINKNYTTDFLARAIETFDKFHFNVYTEKYRKSIENNAPLSMTYMAMLDEWNKKPEICSVIFYPLKNKTLLTIHSNEFEKECATGLKAKPYYYFDNTDKPEEISEKDWEIRYKEWKKVMEPTWTPSLQGFNIDLIEKYLPVSLNKEERLVIFNNFKDLTEHRVKDIAENILFNEFQEKSKNKNYSVYFDFCDALKTSLKSRYEKLKNKISKKIKPITLEDLSKILQNL